MSASNMTNLNIRTDKNVKAAAEKIFEDLGMNMTTAVNVFLRQTIRENGIPFALKLDIPNEIAASAISESRKSAQDQTVKKDFSTEDLKAAQL